MKNKYKHQIFFIIFLILNCSFFSAQDVYQREVPFTAELYEFIDLCLNHQLISRELLDFYFNRAENSRPENWDEYSKLVHSGRCLYFYGLSLMDDYDISDMAKVNLNDTSEKEALNKLAAKYFDKTIDLCRDALKIKKGTDAYSLICNGISANCTAKNTAYIIRNGIKVSSYAKKSITQNFSNGTAHYLESCQSVYAPVPFCNVEEGKKRMISYLDNCYIQNEKFDTFYILSAIGYSCQRLNQNDEALLWYGKSLEIYPENVSVNRLVKKLNETNKDRKQ